MNLSNSTISRAGVLLLTLGDQTRCEVVILLQKSHVKVYNISDTAMKTRGLKKRGGHLGGTPLRCKRLQLLWRPLMAGPSCDPSCVQGSKFLPCHFKTKQYLTFFLGKKKKTPTKNPPQNTTKAVQELYSNI